MKGTDLKKQSSLIVRKAEKIAVSDQKTLSVAETMLVQVKDLINGITEYFEDAVHKAFEAHKAIVAKRKEAVEPLRNAEKILKAGIKDYLVEEARKRREEEERREFEQQALLEKLAKQKDAGKEKAADRTIEQIQEVHEETMKIEEKPALSGTSTRKTWKWRVTDISIIPREYFNLNEILINNVVKANKGNTRIPGIEVYEDVSVAMKRS